MPKNLNNEQEEAKQLHAMQIWLNITLDAVRQLASMENEDNTQLSVAYKTVSALLTAPEINIENFTEDSPFTKEQLFCIYHNAIHSAITYLSPVDCAQSEEILNAAMAGLKKYLDANPNEKDGSLEPSFVIRPNLDDSSKYDVIMVINK